MLLILLLPWLVNGLLCCFRAYYCNRCSVDLPVGEGWTFLDGSSLTPLCFWNIENWIFFTIVIAMLIVEVSCWIINLLHLSCFGIWKQKCDSRFIWFLIGSFTASQSLLPFAKHVFVTLNIHLKLFSNFTWYICVQ